MFLITYVIVWTVAMKASKVGLYQFSAGVLCMILYTCMHVDQSVWTEKNKRCSVAFIYHLLSIFGKIPVENMEKKIWMMYIQKLCIHLNPVYYSEHNC